MTKWEYLTREIRNGADHDMLSDMDDLGNEGWEFCEWVYGWIWSEGPGPDRRTALFKRPVTESGANDG